MGRLMLFHMIGGICMRTALSDSIRIFLAYKAGESELQSQAFIQNPLKLHPVLDLHYVLNLTIPNSSHLN